MPTATRLQLLRVVLGTPDVPDRDLLARFVASRDEEAFAEIVRRHGPMVLATCRRVTGRPHDADDAFQAAFLVLARRAAHINRPELLANWLYGVACRTALEARAARRRVEEHVVPAAPEPAAPTPPDDTAELRRVIDDELAKLPDKYRTAVVLCDLEGLPRAAAAAQLGIPEGTLSSRLAHARKVLADRLSRRGVTASSAVVATALTRDAVAVTIPYSLTHITVHAAVRFAPGASCPPEVSAAVSSLTDGVLKTMLATRLKNLFAVGLLTCGLIGVGTALAQQFGAPVPDDGRLPAVAFDPFGAQDEPPKKQAEPKKIAAKGIEDDDVPYGSFPTQAVVRIEDGKLIVRQRGHRYEPVTEKVGDRPVTSYQLKSGVNATTHDPADVAVFDMKGNRLAQKDWKAQLKNDVHALIAHDGKLPNPRELTLFKADTLLVVLPGLAAAPAFPPVAGGVPYYVPSTTAPGLPPARTVPAAPSATPPAVRPARPSSVAPPAPGTTLPGLPPPLVPAQPILPPADLPESVRGAVNTELTGDLMRITIGIDAGLEIGSKLDVYRETGGGKYLGTLTITEALPKEAVGRFKPARRVAIKELRPEELPRKGDVVGYVLTETLPAPEPLPQ